LQMTSFNIKDLLQDMISMGSLDRSFFNPGSLYLLVAFKA